MTVNWNEDCILAQRRTGSTTNPFVAVEQTITVIQGTAILREIPNKAQKIEINASDLWNSITTYQIGDLVYTETDGVKSSFECLVSCTNKSVTNATYWQQVYFVEVLNSNTTLTKYQYFTDYLNGIVYHNSFFTNRELLYNFLGEGVHFFPSSRVWVESTGTEVTATLEDIISTSAKSITFHTTSPTVSDGVDGDIWFVYQE